LKRQCQPHVTEAAKTSVEGICTKMYNMACDSAKKILSRHWEMLKEQNISGKSFQAWYSSGLTRISFHWCKSGEIFVHAKRGRRLKMLINKMTLLRNSRCRNNSKTLTLSFPYYPLMSQFLCSWKGKHRVAALFVRPSYILSGK